MPEKYPTKEDMDKLIKERNAVYEKHKYRKSSMWVDTGSKSVKCDQDVQKRMMEDTYGIDWNDIND